MDKLLATRLIGQAIQMERQAEQIRKTAPISYQEDMERAKDLRSAAAILRELDATAAPVVVGEDRRCWCETCRPITVTDSRMVLCPDCGNKRCPHANDHRNACTGSNEPGQAGSSYP